MHIRLNQNAEQVWLPHAYIRRKRLVDTLKEMRESPSLPVDKYGYGKVMAAERRIKVEYRIVLVNKIIQTLEHPPGIGEIILDQADLDLLGIPDPNEPK